MKKRIIAFTAMILLLIGTLAINCFASEAEENAFNNEYISHTVTSYFAKPTTENRKFGSVELNYKDNYGYGFTGFESDLIQPSDIFTYNDDNSIAKIESTYALNISSYKVHTKTGEVKTFTGDTTLYIYLLVKPYNNDFEVYQSLIIKDNNVNNIGIRVNYKLCLFVNPTTFEFSYEVVSQRINISCGDNVISPEDMWNDGGHFIDDNDNAHSYTVFDYFEFEHQTNPADYNIACFYAKIQQRNDEEKSLISNYETAYNKGKEVGILEGYEEGKQIAGDAYYKNGYDAGVEDGIKEGLIQGNSEAYNKGYYEGTKSSVSENVKANLEKVADKANNKGSFSSLLATVIETPVNIMQDILNFDILGVNLKLAIGSLITIMLTIVILRKIK